jgi:hypothetical protein
MFNKPQQLNAQEFYNPYENDVRSAMRNRRFNARPLLERNMASQNAYNKNVRSVAGSRGELLSNYGAGYAARMRADAEGYTIKDNQDNAYLGEQAQMDNNLGQQISQTKLGVQNMNDQNTAAHRNFLSASATQGSQWAQNQQLMKNQRTTDVFRGEAIKGMAPYLENWAPETWKYIAEQGRKKGYIS